MTLSELRAAVSGAVITPDDSEWDAARLFHSGIGLPTAIVRPASLADVRAAVMWAAASGSPVVVRGGGHGPWGSVPGGLTVDLGAFTSVDVDIDADGALVRVGGGATWGDVARTLAPRGLGISSGDTASVGVGGLTLGGGIGWMTRAWGLTIDQLVGAEVVTAAGDLVEVSSDVEPDLFWALRGGGGNFGVVTRFDFRAHELPAVVFATMTIEGDARPVITALAEALVDAPRDVTVTYMDVPPMDPSAPAGATITACWANDDAGAARAVLGPIAESPGVSSFDIAVQAYPDILLDMPAYDPAAPMPGFVGGNTLLPVLDEIAIDRLVAFREDHPASVVLLRSLGGAFGDVPPETTAFAARDATWFAMAGAFDLPGLLSDDERAAIVAEWSAIESLGVGVYGNFTTSTTEDWVPRMYPPATLARLSAVKRSWDPGNVFSRTHNVAPA
ncbi:FAD-binding oxidoreductase [Microbacterium sp. SLBN-146]|uniref:FAD-binding oxidoreductase n=1 Tax=Microbacterium sp. SLBN-146 TaxID=2768457 RepID=UPI00114F984D|nr:FAD-binding oxidoreductase [Microbacterium sp. SLBN-146]